MKYLPFFLIIIGHHASAQQHTLKFDQPFIKAEDNWVAFPLNVKDSTYPFGFIYMDMSAGLTFEFTGSFKVDENGNYVSKKILNASYKYRLQANQTKVAIISKEKLTELGVKEIPDWLHNYKVKDI